MRRLGLSAVNARIGRDVVPAVLVAGVAVACWSLDAEPRRILG